VLVDRLERIDLIRHRLRHRRGPEGEGFEQMRRMASEMTLAGSDQMQVIERLGLWQLIRFDDALCEGIPWYDLDGRGRVAPLFLAPINSCPTRDTVGRSRSQYFD
jgi:hypothetical protein